MDVVRSFFCTVVAGLLLISASAAIQANLRRDQSGTPVPLPGGAEKSAGAAADRPDSFAIRGHRPTAPDALDPIDPPAAPRAARGSAPVGAGLARAPIPGAGESPRSTHLVAFARDVRDETTPGATAPGHQMSLGGGGTGAPATGGPASPGPGGNASFVKEVFFGQTGETACQPQDPQFLLAQLRALYVCVIWSGVAGAYLEQLTFLAPDGSVYQALAVPFATPGAELESPTVEFQGRQLAVTPASQGAPGETLVLAQLPVAGTFITQNTLAGEWKVQVSLNGRPVDWGSFTLSQ